MQALIRNALKRKGEWKKIVCNVPAPIIEAMEDFPDLLDRYDHLVKDALQVLAGGHPEHFCY